MKNKFFSMFLMISITMLANQAIASLTSEVGKNIGKNIASTIALTAGALMTAQASEEYQKIINTELSPEEIKAIRGYDDKSAIYTMDIQLVDLSGIFSSPDIYVVLDIEGGGKFISPYIEHSFKGGRFLRTIHAKNNIPGSKVQISIYDSDADSNEMFNNLLRTSFHAEANFAVPVPVSISASGIQIVKDGQTLTLNAPDVISTVTFKTPDEDVIFGSKREDLEDENGKLIGKIEFNKKYMEEVNSTPFKFIFFGIIGAGFLIIFLKKVFSKT